MPLAVEKATSPKAWLVACTYACLALGAAHRALDDDAVDAWCPLHTALLTHAGEYMFWWAHYATCYAASTGCLLGWPAAGAAGLTLLLQTGSLWITEYISCSKYPLYRQYQRATHAVVPWLPGRPLAEKAE